MSASLSGLRIERLQAPQTEAYRALMLEAYAAHPDAFTSSVDERAALPLEWWRARLAEGGREQVLALIDDDTLAGAVGLAFESREKARHKAHLLGLYVRPAWRGRGLARLLVQTALAAARARDGLRLVQLTVTESNASAVALYTRLGFQTFGCEPMAVRTGERFVNKLHMWCDLQPS